MKITGMALFPVKPDWLFLKLTTDTGVAGWGEILPDGRPRTVAGAIADLEPLLAGKDPRQVEPLYQALQRATLHRGGAVWQGVLGGIEQALWDLAGRALNAPVHALFGGACRPRIRLCAHCGGATPQDSAFQAKGWRVKGYTAILLALEPGARGRETPDLLDKIAARFAAVRAEVGRDVDIGLDLHGHLGPALVHRLLPLLAPHDPLFVADPCSPGNSHVLAALAAGGSVPLATGARCHSRAAFRDLLRAGGVAVLQPGVTTTGGIAETRRIAELAALDDVAVALHHAAGPIGLAASLQVAACVPNLLVQEHPGLINKWDLGQGFLLNPFTLRDGYLELPAGPGLGIEVNEDALRDRAGDSNHTPPAPA